MFKNSVHQKALSILLAFSVVLSVFQFAGITAFAAEDEGVTAYYCNSGLFKDPNCKDSNIIGIDDDYRAGITDVEFRGSVTAIGEAAFFGCTSLTGITIPEGVTSIGAGAFYNCTGLTGITIPEGVTSIGEAAFCGCTSLTAIAMPDSVTTIGDSAFAGCTSLTGITIPEGVTSIGSQAFSGCTGFINFTMPDISGIGNDAFNGCSTVNLYCAASVTSSPEAVNKYKFVEDTDTGGCVLKKYSGTSVDVAIPDEFYGKSVTSIGEGAFESCTGLQKIAIPASVTTIGVDAFENCISLTNVAIPAGVTTTIGSKAFCNCTGLTCVTVGQNASVGQNAFENCLCLKNIYVLGDAFPTGFSNVANVFYFQEKDDKTGYSYTNYSGTGVGIVIPKTLYGKDIDPDIDENDVKGKTKDEVAYCDGAELYKNSDGTGEINENSSYRSIISKIEFTSETITTIGEGAFENCTGLTGITIPEGVTSIGQKAFYNCTGLTGITIPEGVTSIGQKAFYNCTSLTGITIPKGVASIGRVAFAGCESLAQFGIDSDNTTFAVSGGVLFSKDENTLICFPAGKSGTYAVPDSVTTIGKGAFYSCVGLTGVLFGSNSLLKVIDADAFCNCGKLTAIVIPDSVTTIGESAFANCEGLTDVSFGPSSHLSDIDESTFALCTGLTAITIPASVKAIGAYAFVECTGLTAITIPACVETIGDSAFNDCSGLTYVKFKGLVTSIGSRAFILGSVTQQFYVPSEYYDNYTALLTAAVTGSTTPNITYMELVTAFGGLPADKTVPAGTARSDLDLPASLSATVNGTEGCTIDSVTWTEKPVYDADTAGTYTFTAKLPSNFELENDEIRPRITVRVAETGKAITSFAIGENDCLINEASHTIAVTVPYGTNVTALTPAITISKNATISPASGIAQDFTKPVTYKVTSENGDTQDYVVTVTISADTRNTGKAITSFAIGGNNCLINETDHTIAVTVPYGTNVTALTPAITVSKNATVSPASGIAQDFTKPVTYKVTAENGDTQDYAVTVTVSANSKDNSKVNFSPVLPATVTDPPTGAMADLSGAAMPTGTTFVSLSVMRKSPSNFSDAAASGAYKLAVTDTKLNVIGTPVIYDLKLLDQNGSAITGFTGTVKVKLPVPAGLRGTPHVFRYEESTGTFTDMNARLENGFLVFSTDHFSYYAFAGVGDSITLDTTSYRMPINGKYQIGVKLTGSKASTVKVHSTNDKTAAVSKLTNGNYQVTGKGTGTAWIMFDVYDNKNRLLTHASVRIDVKTGIRPRGDSTRQIGVF